MCPPEGSQCVDKHLLKMEGQGLGDFHHHLSQKSFMFTNSHKKRVPALVHSSMDGFGGRRVKYTPDPAAHPREEASSAAPHVGGGSQQGRYGQDLAKCVYVHGTGALPKAHSSWWQTLCECWLRPKPACLHKRHASNNHQITQNSHNPSLRFWQYIEYTPSSLSDRTWCFPKIVLSHRKPCFQIIPKTIWWVWRFVMEAEISKCKATTRWPRCILCTEVCHQLKCWVKLLQSKIKLCRGWVGMQKPWVSGSHYYWLQVRNNLILTPQLKSTMCINWIHRRESHTLSVPGLPLKLDKLLHWFLAPVFVTHTGGCTTLFFYVTLFFFFL